MNETEAFNRLNTLLNELNPYAIKPGLERISSFCRRVGTPQDKFNSILIGGTNGKGSVSQMLTDALTYSGYTTGTYTSPHLILLNERFRVNNKPLSFSELLEYAEFVKKNNKENLTYFEFLTAMAFLIFADKKVDMGILEVGMGGEFDATNVTKPLISILTSISLDHTEYLGKTLKEIARTKSGVIKRLGIIAPNPKEVIDAIKNSTEAPLLFVDEKYMELAKKFSKENSPSIKNIAVTLLAIDTLNKRYDYSIDKNHIKKSYWPGRFELIKTTGSKTIIFDGAHNEEATKNLLGLIRRFDTFKNGVLVFATLRQKSWRKNINLLSKLFDEVALPGLSYRLAENPKNIKSHLEKSGYKGNITVFESVNECINAIIDRNLKLILFTGSLYLVGEAKASKLKYNVTESDIYRCNNKENE